jgi:tRNA (cmo5U34)-methyltransferase
MVKVICHRLAPEMKSGRVIVEHMDLRDAYPDVRACVTLCVLTLQFVPIEYRQNVITEIFRHTVSGGAVILVEKVLGRSSELDSVMVSNYLRLKSRHGYSRDDIDCKRRSLEGALVPLTAEWNESLLTTAGFANVDCFWRWMNFAGWVAVRNEHLQPSPASIER